MNKTINFRVDKIRKEEINEAKKIWGCNTTDYFLKLHKTFGYPIALQFKEREKESIITDEHLEKAKQILNADLKFDKETKKKVLDFLNKEL